MKTFVKNLIIMALCLTVLPIFAVEENNSPKRVVNKDYILNSITKYTETINSNPNLEDGYINRAYLNYLIGNLQEAILDYDKLIQLNPNNEEFYLNRGYLKHLSHKRESALQDYNMALKIKPDYAFAHNNRGVVLYELGKTEDSMLAYDTAIKINPNYADAYYNRGNLKTRTNKNQEALEDFNTAIKLNPTDSASFNNRGVVKRKLNYNVGALSDFSIAIKLNPEDITAFANRGRLKKRYFDSEGAEQDFKNAIALAEESPVIIKEIEIEKQIAANQKPAVISKTPDNVKFYSAPADMNKALRNPKITQDSIQKITQKYKMSETNEDNVKVATLKANVVKVDPTQIHNKVTQQTPVNTIPDITTKPVANPELAECYYIRALQKYILQNRESALKDFDMAIQYNPNYAEAYYYRAAIKRDLNDEGFVDDYRKAVQINPSLKAIDEANVLTILKI